jgi:hypothetical protein
MVREVDAGTVFAAMHHHVTGELLHLMDGLFANIEDGLFELAFRADHNDQKRRCFDLMRDLRLQRSRVVQTFARRTQVAFNAWIRPADTANATACQNDPRAKRMAQKSTAHFGGILQTLAERAAYALEGDVDRDQLPMGPYQIATCFVESMKALRFDDTSIDIVAGLFGRFVLERLGSIYGECNRHLEQAGFLTPAEMAAFDTRVRA